MYRHMCEVYDLANVENYQKSEKNKSRRSTIAHCAQPQKKPVECPTKSITEIKNPIPNVPPTKNGCIEKENNNPADIFAQKVIDETSRLSDKQRDIIQKTFEVIERDSVRNGLKIFVSLFSEYPRYKLIWPQFRAIPDSSLMNAVELRRHASVYFAGLGKIISSMRDEEALGREMSRIALAHIKWNVQRNHVIHMIEPVLDVVKACNGYVLDEETRNAWTVLFNVIANLIEVFRCRALKE